MWGGVISCSHDSGGSGGTEKKDTSEKEQNSDGTITLKIQEGGSGFVSTTGEVKTEFQGYTGDGYLDGLTDGGNVVYTVYAAENINDVKIAIHYLCTEVSRVRAALVAVNGTVVNADSPLAMTTDQKVKKDECNASHWKDTVFLENISFNKGENRIIITGAPAGTHTAAGGDSITVGDGGYLNYIDYLIVTGNGIDFGTDKTPWYALSYRSENATAGSVTSETNQGSVRKGTSIALEAKANAGWEFECWSDGTTTNPYTFIIEKATTLSAHFIPENYTAPSGLLGYATITSDGGAKYTITGGAGGETIMIGNHSDLTTNAEKLSNDIPYIVLFTNGTRITTNDNKSEYYTVGSNKTIYGTVKGAGLKNIELRISGNNVIVRNMVLGEVIGDDTFGGTGNDALSINGAKHVWIDHCELFSHLEPKDNNGTPAKDASEPKDWYDGLLDVKNGATWITVSNCYLHDHWKAVLCGSGDTHDDGDSAMRITFVGNYFENINSRQPLFRWGKAHIYNNYYKGASDKQANCIDVRIDSQVLAEGNCFESVKNAIGIDLANGKPSTMGKAEYSFPDSNKLESCTNTPSKGSSSYRPPYQYMLKSAAEAKAAAEKLRESVFLEGLK